MPTKIKFKRIDDLVFSIRLLVKDNIEPTISGTRVSIIASIVPILELLIRQNPFLLQYKYIFC
jgi:hypothetical protein